MFRTRYNIYTKRFIAQIGRTAIWLTVSLFIASCANEDLSEPEITTNPGAAIVPEFSDLNQFFDCLEDQDIALISAHRGGEPENSIDGMENTLFALPAIMEIDVATSKDGVLFLMHDDTLERTTTGTGNIENRTWNYIKEQHLIDRNGNERDVKPPSFADTLAWAAEKTILQIDFKRSTRFEDVIAEVKRQKATSRVIYIAYSEGQARKLHRLHPEAMISVNISSSADLNSAIRAGIPASKILGWAGNDAPDAELFRLLNEKDVEVIFGTLGGRNSIDNRIAKSGNNGDYAMIVRQGIDILATDRPEAAFNALKAAGRELGDAGCGVYTGGPPTRPY